MDELYCPQNSFIKVLTPVLQSVTVTSGRLFEEALSLMISHGWDIMV